MKREKVDGSWDVIAMKKFCSAGLAAYRMCIKKAPYFSALCVDIRITYIQKNTAAHFYAGAHRTQALFF
jgi:hypothetical protein